MHTPIPSQPLAYSGNRQKTAHWLGTQGQITGKFRSKEGSLRSDFCLEMLIAPAVGCARGTPVGQHFPKNKRGFADMWRPTLPTTWHWVPLGAKVAIQQEKVLKTLIPGYGCLWHPPPGG